MGQPHLARGVGHLHLERHARKRYGEDEGPGQPAAGDSRKAPRKPFLPTNRATFKRLEIDLPHGVDRKMSSNADLPPEAEGQSLKRGGVTRSSQHGTRPMTLC